MLALLDIFTEFMYNTIDKNILKNNFSSNEAIKFFGSRRFWWVGRNGETNKILFSALANWIPSSIYKDPFHECVEHH
jgi:hypothetical protein